MWCTQRSSTNSDHLIPWCDAHCGAWLCGVMHTAESDSAVGCTPRSFLKIQIFWRNQNRIRKYLSLFIRGPDGFKSWKNCRLKISWHTPFKASLTRKKYLQCLPFAVKMEFRQNNIRCNITKIRSDCRNNCNNNNYDKTLQFPPIRLLLHIIFI